MNTLSKTVKQQGRQQVWLADKLGVSTALVSLWLNGEWSVADKYKLRISEILGVPVDILFPITNEAKNHAD